MEYETLNKCNVDPNDIIEVNKLMGQLKTPSTMKSKEYNTNLLLLKKILQKYNAQHYKCLIDANFKTQYDNMCQNQDMINNLSNTLNLVEGLIDNYGTDILDMLDSYINIIKDLTKDCDKSQNKELISRAERVSHKLMGLMDMYRKRHKIPNMYECDCFISKNQAMYVGFVIVIMIIIYFFYRKYE
jgi:hypothetical protein